MRGIAICAADSGGRRPARSHTPCGKQPGAHAVTIASACSRGGSENACWTHALLRSSRTGRALLLAARSQQSTARSTLPRLGVGIHLYRAGDANAQNIRHHVAEARGSHG